MTTPRFGRTAKRVALLALLVTGSLATSLQGGSALAAGDYESAPVHAAAEGVRVTLSAPDFLLVSDLFDAGVPVAQTALQYNIGLSKGFASNPYPGEAVVTTPGLVAGQTGQPVPDYPAYADSTYPAKSKSTVEQQGYALRSHSARTSSEATATAGLAPAGGQVGQVAATAVSRVDPSKGVATAQAESDAQALAFNDVLRIGRVHSRAIVTVGPDGTVTRSSDLSIADTTVNGQRVAITPQGVVVAGKATALPSADPIAEALEAAGVRVRYLAEDKTANGIIAAGIEVSARQQLPNGVTGVVRYTLGRAVAGAEPVAEEPSEARTDLRPVTGVEEPGAASGGSEPGGSAAPAVGSPDPLAAPSQAAPAPAPAPSVAPPASTALRLVGTPVDIGATGLYLVLAFAGLAMFASGTLLRLLGVRTRWS